MKRTINSTGRKALKRENVSLRLIEGRGGSPSFTASFSGLIELGLDPEARIYVEPYSGSSLMRFSFGTVGLPLAPAETTLTDLDLGQAILFDIKIVDESEVIGRILASARQVRPESESDDSSDRRSLLPVETADLGELLWQLDAPEGTWPLLRISSRIPGGLGRLRDDPMMQGCILPGAIADLVTRVLDPDSGDTDDHEWVVAWKIWIADITGYEAEEVPDATQREQMVNSICVQFASQMKFATRCAEASTIDTEAEIYD